MKKNKTDRYIDSLHDIKDKLVIVTGANRGLGFETARVALLKGARVVLACRNTQRAEDAKEQLIKETGNENVVVEAFDQSSVKSIHAFTSLIKEKYNDFYSIVLNAGIMPRKKDNDEFNIANVYRTNYIGPMIFMNDIIDLLNDSNVERRIIIQGSMVSFIHKYVHKNSFIHGEEKPMKLYALSKLCVSNLYVHYRDNNHNRNIKYLLCEPGIAATNLFGSVNKVFDSIAGLFFKIFGNTARTGALSGCKLMCDAAANGDYYRPRYLKSAKGLPKKVEFPKEFIFKDIIEDAQEIVEMYENAQ